MAGTSKRLMVGLLLGTCAIGVPAAIVWTNSAERTPVYTDGGSISTPAEEAQVREVMWTEPVPDEGGVNSADHETGATGDPQTMFVVRGRPGTGTDLYVAHRVNGEWGEPEPFAPANTDADELAPELSRDGGTLFFASDREGGLGGFDLWMVRRDGDGWGDAQLVEGVNSPWHDTDPAISRDGSLLLFASNRPIGEQGGAFDAPYDIYRADADDEGFGEPARVHALSTPANDTSPSFSPSGDFVYFSSDRVGTVGGLDLFRARVQTSGFGPVEPLGDVNSPANELDPLITMAGFELRFSSDRDSGYDVYRSTSREVFADVVLSKRDIDWGALWDKLWPWLLAIALLTALAAAILGAVGNERWQRRWHTLGLMARCVLVSLAIHALLLLVFSVWHVTTTLEDAMRGTDPARVALVSHAASDAIEGQIQGSVSDVVVEPSEASASEAATITAQRDMQEPATFEPTSSDRSDEPTREIERAEASESDDPTRPETRDEPIEVAQNASVQTPDVPTRRSGTERAVEIRPAEASANDAPNIETRTARSEPDAPAIARSESRTEASTVAEIAPTTTAASSDIARPEIDSAPIGEPTTDVAQAVRLPESGQRRAVQDEPSAPTNAGGGSASPAVEAAPVFASSASADEQAPVFEPVSGGGSAGAADVRIGASSTHDTALDSIAAPVSGAVEGVETATQPSVNLPGFGERPRAEAASEAGASSIGAPSDAPEIGHAPIAGKVRDEGSIGIEPSARDESAPMPAGVVATNLPGGGGEEIPTPDSVDPGHELGSPLGLAISLPTETEPEIVVPALRLRGVVLDVETGDPIDGALVRLDFTDDGDLEPIEASTGRNGRFELVPERVLDHVAVTASAEGYEPSALNVPARDFERDADSVILLRRVRDDVIALEERPEVHHLGNDRFTGRINSQFQKESEGLTFESSFTLDGVQARPRRARIKMLVKGVQLENEVRINGFLLSDRLDDSPDDGGFGEWAGRVPPGLLREGENTVEIRSIKRGNTDFDDFEIVNIRIELDLSRRASEPI